MFNVEKFKLLKSSISEKNINTVSEKKTLPPRDYKYPAIQHGTQCGECWYFDDNPIATSCFYYNMDTSDYSIGCENFRKITH